VALRVVFRRQVGRDAAAAFDYYEAQQAGLGERFLAAARTVFEAVERVRRAVVSRFPYAVFYRVEQHRIVVVRLLHFARDPNMWPRARRS
jgi:plasmid stabilization system protein ParE